MEVAMKPMYSKLCGSRSIFATFCFVSVAMFLQIGCGGGGSSGPPPPQDFSLSVSPSTISMTVGTLSPPSVITVAGQNGFAGTVNVAITGLPPGATSTPASPLVLPASGSAQVLIFIPPTTPDGALSIELNATSGSLSHSAGLKVTLTPVTGTAVLQDASGQVAAGTIEIQGLSAGTFNPDYWQKNTLNWVPDMRMPMLAPQSTGPYQNIYAPWPLEQAGGWRLFYGGWDGQDVPFDQIFSVTTSDFLSFANRDHIIANGAFLNVNNVNVQKLLDGSFHMICTGGQAADSFTKPVYFQSPDGFTWNGTPEPYSAQLTDVISIQGYAPFNSGNFNGANVLLNDNGTWVLYFKDWNQFDTTYRATAVTLPNFQFQGAALRSNDFVQDLKKITVSGQSWYLMGLVEADPKQSIFYSLSKDPANFPSEQTLFNHLSAQDLYMVALGFVTRGNEMLGVLYGAGAVETLDQNRIFARWLQKKVAITDSSGVQYFVQGGYGPDRQWFHAPTSGTLEGTMVVYAEDGLTPLGSSLVTLTAGKAYALVLN
jgi:hypothetical protein